MTASEKNILDIDRDSLDVLSRLVTERIENGAALVAANTAELRAEWFEAHAIVCDARAAAAAAPVTGDLHADYLADRAAFLHRRDAQEARLCAARIRQG